MALVLELMISFIVLENCWERNSFHWMYLVIIQIQTGYVSSSYYNPNSNLSIQVNFYLLLINHSQTQWEQTIRPYSKQGNLSLTTTWSRKCPNITCPIWSIKLPTSNSSSNNSPLMIRPNSPSSAKNSKIGKNFSPNIWPNFKVVIILILFRVLRAVGGSFVFFVL